MPRHAIVEAPSNLGLMPTGVERTPETLIELGLGRRLGAASVARVEAPAYEAARDPATGMLNPAGIAGYTPRLADAVEAAVGRGETPVVLGGDCSILLGCLLALKRRGRYGLLFVDGHTDFYDPATSVSGQGADMDLSLATGRGPALVTDLEGRRPYVRDADAVVFGYRDSPVARKHRAKDVRDTAITAFDLAAVRGAGAEAAATRAAWQLASAPTDGFWIHLDADVLDDRIMPAVDYRQSDGLSHDELAATLAAACATGRVVGIDITIYNPNLDDAERTAGRGLVDCVARGFGAP
jgi:arginase